MFLVDWVIVLTLLLWWKENKDVSELWKRKLNEWKYIVYNRRKNLFKISCKIIRNLILFSTKKLLCNSLNYFQLVQFENSPVCGLKILNEKCNSTRTEQNGEGDGVLYLFTLGTTDHTHILLGGHWVKLLKWISVKWIWANMMRLPEPIIIMESNRIVILKGVGCGLICGIARKCVCWY